MAATPLYHLSLPCQGGRSSPPRRISPRHKRRLRVAPYKDQARVASSAIAHHWHNASAYARRHGDMVAAIQHRINAGVMILSRSSTSRKDARRISARRQGGAQNSGALAGMVGCAARVGRTVAWRSGALPSAVLFLTIPAHFFLASTWDINIPSWDYI